VADCCEHGSGISDSIKCGEFLNQLSGYELSKKGLWSIEIVYEVCNSDMQVDVRDVSYVMW
jgi:hypothetical protein